MTAHDGPRDPLCLKLEVKSSAKKQLDTQTTTLPPRSLVALHNTPIQQ